MTIYDLPSVKISDSQFGLQSNTVATRSAFNDYLTTSQRIGSFWVGSYTIAPMKATNDDGKAWQAFLMKLDGASGRFYGFDPDRRTPAGTGVGTPLVNGADQKGFELVTNGWGNSQTVLKIGDYFEVNNELKMVVEDCVSDGSGNATITFAPELRTSPPDNEPLTITSPKGIFMLTDAQQVWSSDKSKVINITMNFREAFDYKVFLLTEEGDNLTTEAGDRFIL